MNKKALLFIFLLFYSFVSAFHLFSLRNMCPKTKKNKLTWKFYHYMCMRGCVIFLLDWMNVAEAWTSKVSCYNDQRLDTLYYLIMWFSLMENYRFSNFHMFVCVSRNLILLRTDNNYSFFIFIMWFCSKQLILFIFYTLTLELCTWGLWLLL